MDDLLVLARKACEAAVQAGAEFADVSVSRGRHASVELEKGAIKSCDAGWSSGLGVRAFVRGGRGYANADGLEEGEALRAARTAVELAKIAEPDPDFVSLPARAEYPVVEGRYDPRIVALGIQDVIRWARENIDSAREVDPDICVAGGGGFGWHESALVNNLGVEAADRGTSVSFSVFAIARRGEDVGSFGDYDAGRMLEDFDPAGLGAKVAREAHRFLGARKIATGVLPVVFGPRAARSVFYGIAMAAAAESVQRNRSYLIGKRGERIASPLLTLIDDPLIPGGMGSSPFDNEGFPRRPLTLVENGVLLHWLHDSYTSAKAREPNTGHAGMGPTNLNPIPGGMTAEEIIRDTKEGLYIPLGGVMANSVTGDFSQTVDFGFKIENGEIAYPVKSTMIGGNMLEFLRSMDAISSDYRAEPGSIMPTLRVQNVRVAGGK
jgi:PmbA protein